VINAEIVFDKVLRNQVLLGGTKADNFFNGAFPKQCPELFSIEYVRCPDKVHRNIFNK
jgi:hypothetical protein